MKNPMDKSEARILRNKAEKRVKKTKVAPNIYFTEADSMKLIHELEVHQIELEMQNHELHLAKEQLALNAKEKYNELYDFAPSAYFTLSKDGTILQLNLAGATLLGMERQKLISSQFHRFLSRQSQPVFKSFLTKILSNQTKTTCELTLSNHEEKPIYVYITGVGTENGEQCLISMLDISKRKLAEEKLLVSHEFNKMILQTIPFGIDIVDESGTILFVNEVFKNQFGLKSPGKKCWEVYRDDQTQCTDCPLHSGVSIGETKSFETSGIAGGNTFQILHSGIHFNGKKAILEIFINVTERKQFVSELIEMKEHAEESDRLKSAFLANMSHEIRTPLNSIMGFASLLPEEESKALMTNYANIIFRSSEQLLHIIDDIVLYSSLQTGILSFHPKPVDILVLLNEVQESFSLPALQDSVELKILTDCEMPVIINTDYEKLKQIFTNLISNAYKYTTRGNISIGFNVANNHLKFYIKDTGMGIPSDELVKVFERFYRGSNINKGVIGGTGLGLSIVNELIELLGGEIWVESETGIGSTFFFTIPLTHSSTAP